MGDRSNLYFRNGDVGIGVYGHWTGTDMANAAAAVLANPAFQKRLGDANYATRIGVQTALETIGASSTAETGFGLWTHATGPDDNEHRIIVIDVDTGDCFVVDNWKDPKPAEQVGKPTAATIAAAMTA